MILKCVRNNKWPNGKITIGNIYEFEIEKERDNKLKQLGI